MSEENVTKLVPTRPDAEIAEDLKQRCAEALKPVLAVMDEAKQAGFVIQFDSIMAQAPIYRHTVINLRVAKYY